ncbi:hypothetical protein Prudu_004751 [Prunus dulcis]|uniref:Uncharacterized protein n=1 Tax=Prunus dulcis TaxID=3755 RepID=A0A4Y1QW51_PRUDU|nr:hypothetical protein Prudu_004751 [Prunus dulcis]
MYDERSSNQLASSPPFFCGSPPSRASYPVIQDEQFGNNSKMAPFFPAPPSSLSERNEGCVRMKTNYADSTQIKRFLNTPEHHQQLLRIGLRCRREMVLGYAGGWIVLRRNPGWSAGHCVSSIGSVVGLSDKEVRLACSKQRASYFANPILGSLY